MASRFETQEGGSKACQSLGKTGLQSRFLWVAAKSRLHTDLQIAVVIAHQQQLKAVGYETLMQLLV